MATIEWAPTVADVAALLRARTRDVNDNEIGTFNTETRPTATQVAALINLASNTVAAKTGVVIEDDNLSEAAKHLATLQAAMMVEVSYFPEDTGEGSAYEALREMYNDLIGALEMAVAEANASGEGAVAGGSGVLPSGAFPADEGGMLGWGTRF